MFKWIVAWLMCGVLALGLVARYGNQRPIGIGGCFLFIVLGPVTLPLLFITVINKAESPCMIHCDGEQW